MMKFAALALSGVIGLAAGMPAALADDETVIRLSIKNHRFLPDRLEVPAKTKVVLLVRNEDAEPEEFESPALRREKIIHPGAEVRVILGKINPGEYPFFGEYHEDTAKGVIVAK